MKDPKQPAVVPALTEIEALIAKGLHREAVEACARMPGTSSALSNALGKALVGVGDMAGAERAFEDAIALDAGNDKAETNLANLLRARGDVAAAIAHYETAIRLRPDAARARASLGQLYWEAGRNSEARPMLEAAHALDPALGAATVRLSRLLTATEGLSVGEAFLREALRGAPDVAIVVAELGSLLHGAGRIDEAASHLERALALGPASAPLLATLGDNLRQRHEITRAVELLERAIVMNPALGDAHLALSFAFGEVGRHEDLERHYDLARSLGATGEAAQSIRLYYLLHDERQTPESLSKAHIEVGEAFAKAAQEDAPIVDGSEDRDEALRAAPRRRLRIGYASPDFRVHVVGLFMEGILGAHDFEKVELELISSASRSDAVTDRIRGRYSFHDVGVLSDDALRRRVRDLDLDVLVDLAGHTRRSRVAAFARRAAPVQATYLGYPSTTGIATFDWRITDAVTDPEGSETEFVERLYRLPDPAWSYTPWAETRPPEPRADASGSVVLGCFNRREKVSHAVIAAWRRVLEARPGARLFLKAKAFSDEGVRRGVVDALGTGLRDRVELAGWRASPVDNYEAYRSIDIALDTYPYNGTTTTCDALWMGVPVVSWRGRTSASRVGGALLGAVGLGDLVAADADEYVAHALRIIDDPERVRRLRAELRGRVEASPLGDPKRLARQLEDAYRAMVSDPLR